jgi:hypothetical protein
MSAGGVTTDTLRVKSSPTDSAHPNRLIDDFLADVRRLRGGRQDPVGKPSLASFFSNGCLFFTGAIEGFEKAELAARSDNGKRRRNTIDAWWRTSCASMCGCWPSVRARNAHCQLDPINSTARSACLAAPCPCWSRLHSSSDLMQTSAHGTSAPAKLTAAWRSSA